MAVEAPQRRLMELQHQRPVGVSGETGDMLQGVHRVALAARRHLEERAVRRGPRPGIEEAGGAAVVAAPQRRVEARRIEAADDAYGRAARTLRRPERRPAVEERAQMARFAAAVATERGKPRGGLVAPEQRARRPLGGGREQ